MIHIVRDGRTVAASLMRLDWGPNTINKAAHFWIEKVSYGLGAESFWGEERVRRVRYEDLVEDPEKTLKTLCRWLNIDYQSEMIKGSGFIPPEYTSEQHALVGRPLSVQRISAWEKELTPRQVEIFETITGDFLLYLGYVPKYGLRARSTTTMERLILGIREMFIRFINRVRYQFRIQRLSR